MSSDALMPESLRSADFLGGESVEERIARAEARLCELRELAGLGMEMVRDLVRPSVAPPEGAELRPAVRSPLDQANAFVRLSRAVRLTLALEAGVEAEIAALRADPAPAPPTAPPVAGGDRTPSHAHPSRPFAGIPYGFVFPPAGGEKPGSAQADDPVENDLSETERAPRGEQDPRAGLLGRVYERLYDVERPERFYDRPFEDSLRDIRRDLGLPPLAAPGDDPDELDAASGALAAPSLRLPSKFAPPRPWRGALPHRPTLRRAHPPDQEPP